MLRPVRKALHFTLVWTTVTLLTFDPAAACKLLGGRRCCTCCCPVPSACDTEQVAGNEPGNPPVEAGPAEPAPADRSGAETPATTADAGPLPARPLAETHPPAPPVDTGAAQNRDGNTIQPDAASSSVSPQKSSPSTTFALPPAPVPVLPIAPKVEPARPAAAQSSATPELPSAAPAITTPKAPASSAPLRPTTPVKPPAFPPVDDDPFAPPASSGGNKASANPTPQPTEPDSDDPFAPLPAAPRAPVSRPTAAAPTALPRGVQLADPVPLGADGRLQVREWVDSSGQFRVQGRLVLLLDGQVRLLKETGRTTTVPMERLSAADRAYVAEVIARYGTDLEQLDQLAAR
jgi:SLA1 homology domain 1, SHD1